MSKRQATVKCRECYGTSIIVGCKPNVSKNELIRMRKCQECDEFFYTTERICSDNAAKFFI